MSTIIILFTLLGLVSSSSIVTRDAEFARLRPRYQDNCLSVTYNDTHGFGDTLGMGDCNYAPGWSLKAETNLGVRLRGAENLVLDGTDKNATGVEIKLQAYNETSESQNWYYRKDSRIALINIFEQVKKCLTLVKEPNPDYNPELVDSAPSVEEKARFSSETINKLKLEVCAFEDEDENTEPKQVWERY